jgi:hypothetical protein
MPMAMRGACSTSWSSYAPRRRPRIAVWSSADFLEQTLAADLRRFDKGGDAFYDQISALHKSVRGSDPDAALYWLVRMLDGGADPLYMGRRIVRMAIEDVGLADPRAWEIALNACATYERLGSPEGELALANAVLYMAVAPKSNAAYVAYNAARAFVAKDKSRGVPEHLRNAPTKLMKELGYGAEYRYAHDEAEGYAAGENYLPEGMPAVHWYQPVGRGLEQKIAEKLAHLRELDAQARRKNDKEAPCWIFNCLRTNLAFVAERLATRGVTLDTTAFEALEAERKRLQVHTQDLQAKRNTLSKQIGMLKGKGEDASAVMAEVAGLGDALKAGETALAELMPRFDTFLELIPNLPHESVPVGRDEPATSRCCAGARRAPSPRRATTSTSARRWAGWISRPA